MKVCALIVTYNPDINEFLKYYQSNRLEFDYVLIIDNSEDKMIQQELYKLGENNDTDIIQLFENMGIAYAQNVGIKKLQDSAKYDFILFLDQDSLLSDGTVEIYLSYYEQLSNKYPIACIGVGHTEDSGSRSKGVKEVQKIISSGSFSPLSVFDKVGLMDASLFIDFVEYDWCWRAVHQNYKIFSVEEIVLGHMEGDGKVYIFGQRMVLPSPIRHYYQYRNFLYLMHKSYVPTRWKITMLFKMIIKIPIYMFVMDKKQKRISYILRGIKDYFLNKRGKFLE